MKTKNIILIILITLVINACEKKEFDKPPINVPVVEFNANTSIKQLKDKYNGTCDTITDDIIIQGVVIANDESGNFYKTLIIQDNTAGIELKIDKSYLYTEYKVGQRIYIKCKNLFLGDYNGTIQLGYIYNNSIGRIPDVLVNEHIFRDSLPGTPPKPVKVDITDLDDFLISQLIQVENVSFDTPNVLFAEQTSSATNRNIRNEGGYTLIVRTSQYADFAQSLIPSGNKTITGVLSKYNKDFQLYLRNISDIAD